MRPGLTTFATRLRLLVAIVGVTLTVATTSCSACRNSSSAASDAGGGAAATAAGQTANGGGATAPTNSSADSPADTPDALTTTRAVYAKLTSYADTGTVVREFPGVIARSRFKSFYRRKPLDFFFEYQDLTNENPKIKGDALDLSRRRVVMWMRNGELQKYQQETGAHETFPSTSNQTNALMNSSAMSNGTSVLIPGLLFAKSNLNSVIRQIDEATDAGIEEVDGHPCRKIVGIASEYYPSGQRVNVRQVTVWVDRDTQLIRKVFEDTAKGRTHDAYNRLTITIDPQLNPTLEDANFEFQVPSNQQ